MNFDLHPRLERDLLLLGEMQLSLVFLMPDSDNPWVIIVPKVNSLSEWHHLDQQQQNTLNSEINTVSITLEEHFKPDKINIGSLGNIVQQLHIHIIARYENDRAWPGPIWGTPSSKNQETINKWKSQIKESLGLIS